MSPVLVLLGASRRRCRRLRTGALRRSGCRCSRSSRCGGQLLLLLLLKLDEPLQLRGLRLVGLREGLVPVAVRRGDVERRGRPAAALLLLLVLVVLVLLRGGEERLHLVVLVLLREEMGNGGRRRGGRRRSGGGGGEGQLLLLLRGSLGTGPSTTAAAGGGSVVERVLPRGSSSVVRGGAEERDEDAADEVRLRGEVDAELRPELAHHGIRRYPGAALRRGVLDQGLHVLRQLLVGQHRGWLAGSGKASVAVAAEVAAVRRLHALLNEN